LSAEKREAERKKARGTEKANNTSKYAPPVRASGTGLGREGGKTKAAPRAKTQPAGRSAMSKAELERTAEVALGSAGIICPEMLYKSLST